MSIQTLLLPSGRGVKLQTLTFEQVDQVELVVAASDKLQLGKGFASAQQFNKLASVEGLSIMIVEMTETAGLESLKDAKWTKVDPADLSERMATYFSAKDMVLLRNRYTAEHEMTPTEIAAVLEKKTDVTPA